LTGCGTHRAGSQEHPPPKENGGPVNIAPVITDPKVYTEVPLEMVPRKRPKKSLKTSKKVPAQKHISGLLKVPGKWETPKMPFPNVHPPGPPKPHGVVQLNPDGQNPRERFLVKTIGSPSFGPKVNRLTRTSLGKLPNQPMLKGPPFWPGHRYHGSMSQLLGPRNASGPKP